MTLQTHIATIEEAAQIMESAASYNLKQGRTIFAHTQQERAKRLREAVQWFSNFERKE